MAVSDNEFTVEKTDEFDVWLNDLRDQAGRIKILGRITRMEKGNFGKVEPVGNGISEMKIDFGPGYRVYFTQLGKKIIILLCGGDKDSQGKDIKLAIALKEGL